MPDYKKLYFRLAGVMSDCIEKQTKAMQDCEEIVISEEPSEIILLNPQEVDKTE